MRPRKYVLTTMICASLACGHAAADGSDELVSALLGETPLFADLQKLTDDFGGRLTGTDANRGAVDWAAARFRDAGVEVSVEEFDMPFGWTETHAAATIVGDVSFPANVIAKPFSTAADNLEAPLRDAGLGTPADFERLGSAAKGAWLLVETPVLDDKVGLAGLFAEYADAASIERLAFASGAAGVVYMSSRPKNLVYRFNASTGTKNRHPLLLMEREHAQRAQRLLRNGASLSLRADVRIDAGGKYPARNVIGEIRGSTHADEIVLFGAHLDSHDLGTGALDNGVNVAMLIDIARQIRRLGLQPKRTIRFALWNGEEQGFIGSWRYTQRHADELDQHVVATSFDIGSGRTVGFFTGGRPGLVTMVDGFLEPVSGLGPFHHIDAPVVGTDNYDFMMQGVPNLVALQSDANYASNYHAESDTFDKVDQYQARLNSAIAAAVIWGFANADERLPRQTAAELRALIGSTDLETQMRNFAVWESWASGERGRNE